MFLKTNFYLQEHSEHYQTHCTRSVFPKIISSGANVRSFFHLNQSFKVNNTCNLYSFVWFDNASHLFKNKFLLPYVYSKPNQNTWTTVLIKLLRTATFLGYSWNFHEQVLDVNPMLKILCIHLCKLTEKYIQ